MNEPENVGPYPFLTAMAKPADAVGNEGCQITIGDSPRPPIDPSLTTNKLPIPAQAQARMVPKPTRTETVQGILDRVKNDIKDDAAFVDAWKDVIEDTRVMFRGKQKPMGDIISYITGILQLPPDMTVVTVRSKEISVGNLMIEITSQLAFAEAGTKMFGERKKDLLARGKNQKASRDLIEAQLASGDDEFRMTRGIWMSADMNYQFWKTMRGLCSDTLDRLSQIYNTLAAEAKINSYNR